MNFLTASFLCFFAVTAFLYYILPAKTQNLFLLLANAVFYLWAGPTAGAWLLGAVVISFFCAWAMEWERWKRLFLILGVLALFGSLFVFKYLNFVTQTFFTLTGRPAPSPFELLLPLGISFYSFSLAGYLFDVYRGKCAPERNFLLFAAYASFFPSILSGPINRARELLPQLRQARRFQLEDFKSGLWRFAWGAGKKLVLASLLAEIIEPAYAGPAAFSGGAWMIVMVAYSLYIYVDFAAYSDMAVGVAKMLGMTLPENFRAPYLSRTAKSFWKKWHISLTSWFREYLYFPLGGSRKGRARTWLNVLIVFAVSGLWHGSGLCFVIWGLLNGLYQMVGDWTRPARTRLRARLHIPEDAWYVALFQGLFTFGLITVAWIFFRADSVGQAVFIIKRILLVLRDGLGNVAAILPGARKGCVLLLGLAALAAEDVAITRGREFTIHRTSFRYWIALAVLCTAILLLGQYGPGFQVSDFTYFQF